MERIQAILGSTGTTSDMSQKEYEQWKADGYNAIEGNRNEEDGYDCRICKNKGHIMKITNYLNGWQQEIVPCKCAEIRNSIRRMKKSGLKNIIKDYTFDKFDASEPWQQTIKNAAVEYAKHLDG